MKVQAFAGSCIYGKEEVVWNRRFVGALSGRLWGAAECCREPQLIEQLGRLDLTPEVQPFAHAALKVSCGACFVGISEAQGCK